MPRPGPDDPAYWPEADQAGASWFDPPGNTFDGWVVFGELPPEPFLSVDPFVPRDWPRSTYGPPGVIWQFDSTDVIERLTSLDLDHSSFVVNRLLRKFGRLPFVSVPFFFPIPNSTPPEGGPMRWVQTSLIGTIGDRESFAHVLNWRHATTENAPMNLAEAREFGTLVRDKWLGFWNSEVPSGGAARQYFGNVVKYTEVRVAVLNQAGPGPWIRTLPHGGREFVDGDRPDWEVPTQVIAFAPPLLNDQANSTLPYQVSVAITHNTNFRGARFRGRTYLPPLSGQYGDNAGTIGGGAALNLGKSFGWFAEQVATDSDYELHVVSKKFATSAKVIGTRVGNVPDTQRRRRRNLLENPVQAWGNAVGTQ